MSQSRLRTLVALTLLVGTGDASRALAAVPEEEVSEAFDDDLSPRDLDYGALLSLFSHHPKASVRARIAGWAVALWFERPSETEVLLGRLAADDSEVVRAAAARSLGLVLAVASPLERVQLIADWALASEAERREAVANALHFPFASPASTLAIEHLSRDPLPGIRRHALAAARRRFAEDPATYHAIAVRLADDPEASIRDAARELTARR